MKPYRVQTWKRSETWRHYCSFEGLVTAAKVASRLVGVAPAYCHRARVLDRRDRVVAEYPRTPAHNGQRVASAMMGCAAER